MAVYRIYLVHRDGSLEPSDSFHCASDQEAKGRLPTSPVPGVTVELWQGGRFIGDLPRLEEAATLR
jgi:hypothetical protein